MVGWKRWFYDLAGWEYDIADEKQRRQKYLVCEQIKKSNHKLTLKDREEKKRPPTPIPDKTLPCFEELMFDMKKNSYAEILTNPKKRRRKRNPSNINF
jgi:hypothetical protein